MMKPTFPEKARLLDRLKKGNFNVPDFIYIPADDFKSENFKALESFIGNHHESFKVIARSGHPQEEFYKGGTFDSLETYADVGGIKYARKRIITSAKNSRRLTILRQQKFNSAPDIDLEEMGVIVMPFIDGISVMTKKLGKQWEFGYSFNRTQQVQKDPYVTQTPHDRKLLQVSEDIQDYLGFKCEIEYIISEDGEIFVVQAKDISHIDTLMQKESERSIRLDGLRRIRKRRSYRERPIFVIDSKSVYLDIISKCEELVLGSEGPGTTIDDILGIISAYDDEMEAFALRNERFGVLGISIQVPEDLFQIANHYLDDMPDIQKQLSKALHNNLYKRDYFLSEADTLMAKDRIRFNLGTHSAYGVDTVRNPLWSVYWHADRHDFIIKEIIRVGFTTGDTIGIDIDAEEKPTVYRL
ncbi:MAG: hypothetical protein P1P89_11655 [Desulfobacterales bacterium]|nr:hypothetical protein [Desulfobacterales bacterium]